MSETNKKYFLDLGGLQTLWAKMKNVFASKTDVNEQFGTISQNIEVLSNEIDGVETLTLSYAPKIAKNYSAAVALAAELSAGTIIIVGENEVVGEVEYNEGFYIVDTNKTISYIGTSTGSTGDNEIADLRSRISTVENQIIKTGSIVDENNNVLSALTIANNSLLMVVDNTFVANSQSTNALTHRAIAAKFGELEALLTSIPKFNIEVVDSLPTSNISHSTIYLVKNAIETSNNVYAEYIYIQDKGWEKLGEQTITLDNYVTKDFLTETLNTALASYATKADVANAIETTKTEILKTVEDTYLTIENATGTFATEESIIDSITTGAIGNEIAITTEQIEALN